MEPDSIAPPPAPVVTIPRVCYRCPGEPDEISVGVHLSRLASFYHKCRLCEHRHEISRLAPSLQRRWEQLLQTPDPVSLFSANGVRGLYLNQLTRNEAAQVAAAFATTLREVLEIWRSRHPAPSTRWMKVVFGHDSRPSSPDLAMAAATTLRQHGCELIDLGRSTRPQIDRTLHAMAADAAFFVTGHDTPVGWNGFDLMGPDGTIWSREGVLDLVEQRFHQSCPRPDREAAPQGIHDATDESLAQLRRDLHGLRPLRVAIETSEPTLRQLLNDSQAHWPGALDLTDSRESRSDVTFRLGEDARQCMVFDEHGEAVPDQQILFLLGRLLLDEHPHVDVVLSDELFERCGWTVERCGPGYLVFHRGGSTEEQLLRTMHSLGSSLALDGQSRYWIRYDGHTRCDGLFTATMVLRSLSHTDRTLSESLTIASSPS